MQFVIAIDLIISGKYNSKHCTRDKGRVSMYGRELSVLYKQGSGVGSVTHSRSCSGPTDHYRPGPRHCRRR